MLLTLDYRPSQPHGWLGGDKPLGVTFGGHTATKDFTFGERHYRVSLLPLDPEYRATPTDQFRQTLDAAFSTHYAFRFLGRPSGRGPFSVQSYTVSVTEATESSPLFFGADLYVVHDTDPLGVTRGTMRWLQVSRSVGTFGGPTEPDEEARVDGMGPANPFYPTGGSVSINGTRVGNLSYLMEVPYGPLPGEQEPPVLDFQFAAEAFLARDTGTKDGTGREVVEVFGGVSYGWQVREVSA
jgi:hypothetical protein